MARAAFTTRGGPVARRGGDDPTRRHFLRVWIVVLFLFAQWECECTNCYPGFTGWGVERGRGQRTLIQQSKLSFLLLLAASETWQCVDGLMPPRALNIPSTWAGAISETADASSRPHMMSDWMMQSFALLITPASLVRWWGSVSSLSID